MMAVLMVALMVALVLTPPDSGHHTDANPEHDEAADQSEPAEDPLPGESRTRRQEDSESQHAAGVRERHGPGDHERVPRPAALAWGVGRESGLTVSGWRGVAGGEDHGEEPREDASPDRDVDSRREIGEAAIEFGDSACERVTW